MSNTPETLDEILKKAMLIANRAKFLGTQKEIDDAGIEAKQAILSLIEERVIGKDMIIGDEIAENRSYTGERIHNAIKAEQRNKLKEL